MRELITGLVKRAGRRGGFLLFLSVLDFGYGIYLLNVPLHVSLRLPQVVWAVAWLVTGAACLAGCFAADDRIPYTCAAAMKAAWTALMADLWLFGHVPYGWLSVLIWGAFSLTVLMVSSWPEPPPPPVVPPPPVAPPRHEGQG